MTLEHSEFCIKVFEDSGSNEESAGEQEQLRKDLRKQEKIMKGKETPLSRRISSAAYPSLSHLHASSSVLLDNGDDDPDDPYTFHEDVPPP